MATLAAAAPAAGRVRFWSTTNGKKAVMAVSGLVLFGFLIGHLAGNLQIFLGPEKINAYGRTLRAMPALTWSVRSVLLVMVTLHIWTSVELAIIKRRARPVGYVVKRPVKSSYASRTMYWSGPILAAFVVYHLMHFTFGTGGTPFDEQDIYANMVNGFRVPVVSAMYVVAMFLVATHLRHGISSLFQTLGLYHPRYTPVLERSATVLAWLMFAGFVSIPLAVLTGYLPAMPTLVAPHRH